MMSHEWEPFCLSLAFGPSVLENLRSCLGRMGPEARAFALAILKRHRIELEPAEQEALFGYLLVSGNWSLGVDDRENTYFESEEGFQYLHRQLVSPATETSLCSAKRLLSLFENRLSPEEKAKCWSRICSGGRCNPEVLREQIIRVLREPSYRALVRVTFEDIGRNLGHVSFLEHVVNAATDESRWRDVVWVLLYERQGMSFDVEDTGQLLLDLGRDYPEYAKPIGEAAKHFLQDPRVKEVRLGENRHWLALIADEFSSLPKGEMREVLITGEWISWSCAYSLIARLGYAPEPLPCRPRTVDFPENLGNETASKTTTGGFVGRLMDWTRPAESFHPETCDAIGQLLYSGDFKDDDLDALARQGTLGIMVSETIRFCAGLLPSFPDRITLVLSGGPPRRFESDRSYHRLLYNVRRFHGTYLEEDPKGREAYATALEQSMRQNRDNIVPLASEILRLRGKIPMDLVTVVFEECASHPGRYHEELAFGVIHWISALKPGAEADAVCQAAEHAIEILDHQGRDVRMAQFPPYTHLLFPIAVWLLGGQVSRESIDLYWEGVRLVFAVSSGEFGIKRSHSVLQDFEILVAKVPQTTWALVREAGVKSDSPGVRSLIGMLGGFTGVLPQTVAHKEPLSPLGPPEPMVT